jgi:hypothetical protein
MPQISARHRRPTRDLREWQALLIDKITVLHHLPDDDFGNPQYGKPVGYMARVDMVTTHRGMGSVGEGQMEPKVTPDVQVITNIYPIFVLDKMYIPDVKLPLIINNIDVVKDMFGPHHIEISATFVRV